ncbi:MAG: hypothetical protein GDYSWBUE_001281 [Candidatus Fervidibacterota bacterium]
MDSQKVTVGQPKDDAANLHHCNAMTRSSSELFKRISHTPTLSKECGQKISLNAFPRAHQRMGRHHVRLP